MESTSTAVLVVGGGLVGLSASIFLAARGVPTVLVERRAGSSAHPRAIGFTERTMELFRAVGLRPRVPQIPRGFRLRRARVDSLAGTWHEESRWNPHEQPPRDMPFSPSSGAAIAQDRLEPILRQRAIELGVDIRLETALIGFAQDDAGVTTSLRRGDGSEYAMRAGYLLAADGHRSPVREALGIARGGRGHLRAVRSVLFRAPLEHYLEKGVMQFEIDQPDFKAFLTNYGDGRWLLMLTDDQARDEAALLPMIFQAIGGTDVAVDIITTGRWELSAAIAERFSSGRVFLAGDAAHTLPPARGGYGANTGIEDAHNLAWKIAAVLSGQSAPTLLDSYDAERRPIAWLRHDQIFARPDYKAFASATAPVTPIIDDDAMELGQLYRSAAVVGAGDELAPALRPDQWAGQPGTRAPHAWVIKDGEQVSTLDLFQSGWLLLAADHGWCAVAARASAALGIGLTCLHIGTDVQAAAEASVRQAFGLAERGASLIRPDGYVAWRLNDMPPAPFEALLEALGQVACAPGRN